MSFGDPYPQCWWCKYLDIDAHKEKLEFKCKAFPDGIPDEIVGDEQGPTFDHRYPHPDDNGIQFIMPPDVNTLLSRLPFSDSTVSQVMGELGSLHKLIDIKRGYGNMLPPISEHDEDS